MLLLAASLFFTTPAPLDMPRAEAYLVREPDGARRLEDRYDVFDMWLYRAVDGRWIDDDFRVFVLSSLDVLPPALHGAETETRTSYEGERVAADPKDDGQLLAMVGLLSPITPAEEFSRPRQKPRGYRDVRYWHGTNTSAIVCSFLPEKSSAWRLATWELADGDDFDEMLEKFVEDFLDAREWESVLAAGGEEPDAGRKPRRRGRGAPSERDLLRRDLRHGVAAYPSWRMTDAEEFSIVDSLPARGFVEALTNDMRVMRAKYAEAIPSPLDGSNVLCVARIYSNREEYLEAAGEAMQWSAAYWSSQRRELVAYLPEAGEKELLKTIRHEAFHQYLSYACSMIAPSPWFNEGYAQYFEGGPDGPGFVDPADVVTLADQLPALMAMDYDEFYAGTDVERLLKYRLALTIAVFLEKGAPEVRFAPFKDLKRDYVAALVETRDMRKATAAALKTEDNMKLFVREWAKYWKER